MKLGIATPVVTNVAGSALEWEKDATIEDIGRVAETADRLGYHHMTCSEHIGLPSTETARRGARYWDPLATFGYASARTKQIRFATMTLVLGYHHPLAIVKRYGTLDHVSGGRVILGVGVGSLKEEFDLLGAPFDDRGARGDDALRALRAALPSNEPAYDGEFYSFSGLTVDPCALSHTCRSGSVAAPNARCDAPSRLPTAGARTTSRSTWPRSGCNRFNCLLISKW